MNFYVYIIQSSFDNSYYKGFTENLQLRIQRHNNGESAYTRNKKPWKYVYVEIFNNKTNALKRERGLKKYSHQQIIQLIGAAKNKINETIITDLS